MMPILFTEGSLFFVHTKGLGVKLDCACSKTTASFHRCNICDRIKLLGFEYDFSPGNICFLYGFSSGKHRSMLIEIYQIYWLI